MIFLLRVHVHACMQAASNSSQNIELMLQESCTDPAGSLVVYATVDVDAVQVAMSGEDPSYIPLLPTGFVVLPADRGGDAGCLLTVGLQTLANSIASAKINLSSVAAVNTHVANVVHQIGAALGSGDSAAAAAAV